MGDSSEHSNVNETDGLPFEQHVNVQILAPEQNEVKLSRKKKTYSIIKIK